MAEVPKVDGVLLQITLTGAEVTSLDRGDAIEFSDPNVGPSSRNWISVKLSKRLEDS